MFLPLRSPRTVMSERRRRRAELVFQLLVTDFEAPCQVGQYFFAADHPFHDDIGNVVANVNNMQDGSGPAWFLLDPLRAIRPIIWQEREGCDFQSMDRPNDESVLPKAM